MTVMQIIATRKRLDGTVLRAVRTGHRGSYGIEWQDMHGQWWRLNQHISAQSDVRWALRMLANSSDQYWSETCRDMRPVPEEKETA
jgi:hypothetical protein